MNFCIDEFWLVLTFPITCANWGLWWCLKKSGYEESITYQKKTAPERKSKNIRRNIIWFNPPFSRNVQTNVGHTFLRLINKHFPKHTKLNKNVNKGNVKVSYSCMQNMACIIKAHNKQILEKTSEQTKSCNCRKKKINAP